MSGPEFFQTGMGRKFHDSDVPRLVEALERIAEAMEKANVLKERELKVEATTPAQVAQEFIVGGLKIGKLNPRIDTACQETIKSLRSEISKDYPLLREWLAIHSHFTTNDAVKKLITAVESLKAGLADAEDIDQSIDDEIGVWIVDNTTLDPKGKAHLKLLEIVTILVLQE